MHLDVAGWVVAALVLCLKSQNPKTDGCWCNWRKENERLAIEGNPNFELTTSSHYYYYVGQSWEGARRHTSSSGLIANNFPLSPSSSATMPWCMCSLRGSFWGRNWTHIWRVLWECSSYIGWVPFPETVLWVSASGFLQVIPLVLFQTLLVFKYF